MLVPKAKPGEDVQSALERISVPSYVLDQTGIVRWINPAAERIGPWATSAAASSRRSSPPRTAGGHASFLAEGARDGGEHGHDGHLRLRRRRPRDARAQLGAAHARRARRRHFGLLSKPLDEEPAPPHPQLTPRQVEVLRLLEQGHSTRQIAEELHVTTETVRHHVRGIFRVLGVHSRLEAVALARRD